MKSLLLVFACVASGLGGVAEAGQGFSVPRPPAVLSPDLAAPWLRQTKPGARPTVTRSRTLARARAAPPRIRPEFLPTIVRYRGGEKPGTIVIDTGHRFLFLVLDGGRAKRYGVGVGRPGFEWAGTHTVTAKAEWPTWTPPEEMREREPGLPASMKGGPDNPLGARALYLGDTLYRIHGSNQPWTIGKAVSSGCIRMRNEDVVDLYERVPVGTRVIVM
ncbi:MAG: L,D-transpeptidase [Bauldia sp.]|uniref:L,D-transpeptidase n=1 Tax=Bauldia sp. TaxID=2575872 RepID=UPI001D30446E|nr:L,D-transpeptidase [Bauldia sp.]MCB1489310.1 L,D-transpeptidase [Bauldia sp.]MCB1494797.1 L,D-transpeptidase [Bauldia sp.]